MDARGRGSSPHANGLNDTNSFVLLHSEQRVELGSHRAHRGSTELHRENYCDLCDLRVKRFPDRRGLLFLLSGGGFSPGCRRLAADAGVRARSREETGRRSGCGGTAD